MKQKKPTVKRTVTTLLMLMAICLSSFAQKIAISGKVVDTNGEELIGASVFVKGNTATGTVSDLSGEFKLNVPSENSTVVVSYVGMVTKEFKVGKKRQFNVALAEDNQLQEVVVVGYGQQKKASVVGAITQTTGEVLERAAGERSDLVFIFLCVVVAGNPVCRVVVCHSKLCVLLLYHEIVQFLLLRELISESHTVVIHAEAYFYVAFR